MKYLGEKGEEMEVNVQLRKAGGDGAEQGRGGIRGEMRGVETS